MRKGSFAKIRVLVSLLLIAVPVLSVIPVPWVVTNINAQTYTIYQVSTSMNYQFSQFTGSEIPFFTLQEVTYSPEYATFTSYEPLCTPGGGVSCPPYLLTIQVSNQTQFITTTVSALAVTGRSTYATSFYTTPITSVGTGYLTYTGTSTSTQVFPVTTGTTTSSSTQTLRQTAIVQASDFLTSFNVLFVVLFLLPLTVMATVIALTFLEREQAFCPRCEARLRRGSGFCDKCGFQLGQSSSNVP